MTSSLLSSSSSVYANKLYYCHDGWIRPNATHTLAKFLPQMVIIYLPDTFFNSAGLQPNIYRHK